MPSIVGVRKGCWEPSSERLSLEHPPPPGLSGNNSELAACFHHLESEVSVSEGGGRCAEWLPGLHAGGGEPGLHAGGDKLLTLFGVELSPPTLMLF